MPLWPQLGQPTYLAHLDSPLRPVQIGSVETDLAHLSHLLAHFSLARTLIARGNSRATASPPWSPLCSGQLRPNQGPPWCSNDSPRDGTSAHPCRSVDFVPVCSCAYAMLADADGSATISADLLFLAIPGCSPPSLVPCVRLGTGLAAVRRRHGRPVPPCRHCCRLLRHQVLLYASPSFSNLPISARSMPGALLRTLLRCCCVTLLLFLLACVVLCCDVLCCAVAHLCSILCLLTLCDVLNPLIHAYMLCKWSLVLVYMPNNGLVHMLAGLFLGLLVDSYAH
jgi:hypothetical protein